LTRKSSLRKRIRSPNGRTQRRAAVRDLPREFLEHSVEALLACGFEPEDLVRQFADACRKARRPITPWNPTNLQRIHTYPHVITHWHRKVHLLDDGKPRALLREQVLNLIVEVFPDTDPTEIFNLLLRVGAIREVAGLFIPDDRKLVLKGVDLWVHGFLVASEYLKSIQSNVERAAEGAGLLFERAVLCPRYPVRRLLKLETDMRARGTSFAEEWDATFERAEVPQGSAESYTPVMVEIFLSHGGQDAGVPGIEPQAVKLKGRRGKAQKTSKRESS